MGKPARGSSRAGQISRSGLWLIGGTLLLSVVVLAWAFQEEPSVGATSGARKTAAPRPTSTSSSSVGIEPPSASDRISQAPSAADYGPLLQHNVFRPLVTPERGGSRPAPSGSGQGRPSAPARVPRGGQASPAPRGSGAEADGPKTTDTWQGWKFNGVAHLDQKAYALMDQPGKKRSRFVKQGDRLEGATVARVAPDEVTLREADGGIVRVQRVDAMAALLRPSRSGSPRPAAPAAAPSAAPAAPGSRSGPAVTTPPDPEAPRGVSPSSTPDERREFFRERRERREQRREAGRSEAGEAPADSED